MNAAVANPAIAPAELEAAARAWWYYTVELAQGVVAQGTHAADFPYMPRVLMRNVQVEGKDCLDLGTMEGIVPLLLAKRGARRVVGADAVPHCAQKMELLKALHGVNYDFRQVGLMYELDAKLKAEGQFDFVNLSGVLYHVMSPLHTLASVRPLVKPGGLFMLSTNVVNEQSDAMHFNTKGMLQTEVNTFWYVSIPLLDYLLRYMNLAPIDCLYLRHKSTSPLFVKGKECGFISIVCRAVDTGAAMPADDGWALRSMTQSWEYPGLSHQHVLKNVPPSDIGYTLPPALAPLVAKHGSIDVYTAVNEFGRRMERAERPEDSYLLRLADRS